MKKAASTPTATTGKSSTSPNSAAPTPKRTRWTILTALNKVFLTLHRSQLQPEKWEECKPAFAYLRKKLDLNEYQSLFVSILADHGEPTTWQEVGNILNLPRLSVIVHANDMQVLVDRRWVKRLTCHNGTECFNLAPGVVEAISQNKPFVPEKIDGMSTQEIMDRMQSHLTKHDNCFTFEITSEKDWLFQLCLANAELPLCHMVLHLKDEYERLFFILLAVDYANWADSENEGIDLEYVADKFPDDIEATFLCQSLRSGSGPLFDNGWVENKCEEGVVNPDCFVLTRASKEQLLGDYKPCHTKRARRTAPTRDIRKVDGIKHKEMFYNHSEQEQINRLTHLLSQDNLPAIQQRLEEEGMRKGFACLFYGAPGTGKTETVLQVARQTGRDIMQIDISGMRDKFVGESEKNIKAVFERYREVCKQSEVMPILFFNEADGVFGKRSKIGNMNPSVDKMENAMQNIILQEMENLEGILIATTNLTVNLDSAFERRFLFKVNFHKPDVDVKVKLWRSMLGKNLTDDDARRLANRYEFSGGQIENIARKCSIEFILSGQKPTINEIDDFCRHELMDTNHKCAAVGFNADR